MLVAPAAPGRDLHHVGGAVAGRKLHDAQPVAADIETHGLGVDRDRAALVAGEVRQIAAVQADGHGGSRSRSRLSNSGGPMRQLPDGCDAPSRCLAHRHAGSILPWTN